MREREFNEDWRDTLNNPLSSYLHLKSDWHPIYEWVASRVEKNVLDIGCGVGHLGHHLTHVHRDNVMSYTGIDISEYAINIARRVAPKGTFYQINALNDPIITMGNYDTICFTEVLEHVYRDMQLLTAIPRNKKIIISLPKENPILHPQHIRFFPDMNSVISRYDKIIDIHEIELISDMFWCFWGVR